MAVQAALVGQKKELVERSLEVLIIQAKAIQAVFEDNQKRLTEIIDEVDRLYEPSTLLELYFGKTFSEEEQKALERLEGEHDAIRRLNKAHVSQWIESLALDKDKLIALNKAGYFDEDFVFRARMLLETADNVSHLVAKLKESAYSEKLKELEGLERAWCELKTQIKEEGYKHYFMTASALALLGAFIAAAYASVIGVVVSTILACACAFTALFLDSGKRYEADLQGLPEAMPEEELKAKLPSLSFFVPQTDEDEEDISWFFNPPAY